MTSEDRIIIELINSRFDAFEKRFDASEKNNAERFEIINGQLVQLRKDVDSLKAEVVEVKHNVNLNAHDIAHLQTSIYWGFALIALGAAFAPILLDMHRDRRQERKERAEYVTRSEMEEAITEAVTKALRMRR